MFDAAIEFGLGCLLVILALGVAGILGWAGATAVDSIHYERAAFAAITNCTSKRMDAQRKFLSTTVVCVPAYRGTKSDTLTLQGVK
jgi:predicted histidine transporter YuiF (NhaC family)